MEIPEDLPLAAFTRREDPRDALVLPAGAGAPDWTRPIGSSSLRRRLQLREMLPEVEVLPVRGNVLTRLRKLDGGEYGALVLAAAGLKRLGLEGRIFRYFEPSQLLPAAGQGILAVQCRAAMDTAFLDCLRDADAEACAKAERAFVGALNGGCSSPVAAHAVVSGERITVTGMYVDEQEQIYREAVSGPASEGEALARTLADRLKEAAAWRGK